MNKFQSAITNRVTEELIMSYTKPACGNLLLLLLASEQAYLNNNFVLHFY